MDANQGDFAGSRSSSGWASVAPEFRQGKAVLVVKTTAAPAKPSPAPAKPGAPRPNGRGKKPRRRR